MSILWNFDKYAKIEELPFDPQCINALDLVPISDVELLLKAGTPLVESSGVVAPLGEDDEPTYFAAEDYHFILTNAQQPKLVKCVTKGYIEKAKVLAAMGAEEDPTADWAEALAALGLYLVDELGALPGSSGGGGSGGGSRTLWYGVAAQSPGGVGEVYKNAAHTETVSADELSAAFYNGLVIAFEDGPMTVDMLAAGIMYSGSDLMGVYCTRPSGEVVSFGPSEQDDGPDSDR